MNNVLYPGSSKRPLTEEEKVSRVELGISPNYQGNPHNPRNLSEDIPDSENCALFLTNLPANCTYAELLRAVATHRPGRVWSTYINPPREMDPDDPLIGELQAAAQAGNVVTQGRAPPRIPASYSTSAAKLIFYHPLEAQRLLQAAAGTFQQPPHDGSGPGPGPGSGLHVGGRRVGVKWNRHRTGAQRYDRPTSRALTIGGPATIVSERRLRGLFDQYFEYATEEVVVVAEGEQGGNGAWRVLEWRFASMRAQAHAAYQLLRSLYPGVVEVRWAVDPCAGYLAVEDAERVLRNLGGGGGKQPVRVIEGINVE